MKSLTVIGFVLCLLLMSQVALAQDKNQPSQTDNAKKGLEPTAPPPIKGAIVLPSACLSYPNTIVQTAAGDPTPDKFGATAEVRVKFVLNAQKTGWLISCGIPKGGYPGPEGFNGHDRTGLEIPVWTAADSKAQFDFLRAEVKSMIVQAVTDNIVKEKTIQVSVSKALEQNKTVTDAVSLALQNSDVFKKAVSEAVDARLADFKDQIVKEILQKVKADAN